MKRKYTTWIPVANSFLMFEPMEDREHCLSSFIEKAPTILESIILECTMLEKGCKVTSVRPAVPSKKEQLYLILTTYPYLNGEQGAHLYTYIRIEITCALAKEVARDMKRQASDSVDITDLHPSLVADAIARSIERLLVLCTIAFPGRFRIFGGRVFSKGRPFSRLSTHYGMFSEEARELSLKTCDLASANEWLSEVYLDNGDSRKLPIQKAFSAYTHFVKSQERDGEQLFRAMQGLEAFYCNRGKSDTMQQLKDGISAFLGEQTISNKTFNSMYEARSGCIHGRYPIRPTVEGLTNPEGEQFKSRQLEEATVLALQLLIRTLQCCIEFSTYGVEFRRRTQIARTTMKGTKESQACLNHESPDPSKLGQTG